MPDKRAVTVYFTDGSSLSLDFPRQTANESAAALKLEEVLKKRQLLVEADGALLMIPFDNVKYIQLYPVPKDAPNIDWIKDATVSK